MNKTTVNRYFVKKSDSANRKSSSRNSYKSRRLWSRTRCKIYWNTMQWRNNIGVFGRRSSIRNRLLLNWKQKQLRYSKIWIIDNQIKRNSHGCGFVLNGDAIGFHCIICIYRIFFWGCLWRLMSYALSIPVIAGFREEVRCWVGDHEGLYAWFDNLWIYLWS